MTPPLEDRSVRLSVIDRLIDDEPGLAADPQISWAESVHRLKDSVLRDLEWLLNTRRIIELAPSAYAEVQRSLYHFGLPDTSSVSRDSPTALRLLLQQIEECIRIFEPRLDNVRVAAVERATEEKRELRFVIEAILRMEPNPERIVFDTVLETARGEFRLEAAIAD